MSGAGNVIMRKRDLEILVKKSFLHLLQVNPLLIYESNSNPVTFSNISYRKLIF